MFLRGGLCKLVRGESAFPKEKFMVGLIEKSSANSYPSSIFILGNFGFESISLFSRFSTLFVMFS